jgi:hypothetical protein
MGSILGRTGTTRMTANPHYRGRMGLRDLFRGPPEADLAEFEREGLLHHEVARGSITYRNFRGYGRYSSWAREAARWTIVVTNRRLTVSRRGHPMVSVPWGDDRIATLGCTVDGDRLVIRADAAHLSDRATGTIEVRARCANPASVLALIESMRSGARG